MQNKVLFSLFVFIMLTVAGGTFFMVKTQAIKEPVKPREETTSLRATYPPVKPTATTSLIASDSSNEEMEVDLQTSVKVGDEMNQEQLEVFEKKYKEKTKKDFGKEEDGLETALTAKYGDTSFILNDSDGKYAQGLLERKNSEDRWWLATRNSSGKWIIVTDGYSYADCKIISAYHFPTSMVPVCWSGNTLKTR